MLQGLLMGAVLGQTATGPRFEVTPKHPIANQMVEVRMTGFLAGPKGVADLAPAIDCQIRRPQGEKLGRSAAMRPIPAFWDGERVRMRFSPNVPGDWQVTLSYQDGARRQVQIPVRVKAGPPAFVRRSPRSPQYLVLGDSEAIPLEGSPKKLPSFFPIGLNLCWPDDRGLESYRDRFAKLKAAGGNFSRIWTTQERLQETIKTGLGQYDAANGDFYDGIFRLADEYGIKLIFTIDDYRVLAKTDYFNAHWDKSPYNAANGGPLKEPLDFFSDPTVKEIYKKRLRYLVARYGAHPSLAAWEIWNEQDHIPKPGVPIEWFREVTAYLRSIDPNRHLITTSFSWDDKAEVWQTPELDLVQRHMYGQGEKADFVGEIQQNARKLAGFGKPRLIGEFGITWKEPDAALDTSKKGTALHNALWASLMAGEAGGVLTWWWDNYFEPSNLWPVFRGISRFVSNLDLAGSTWEDARLEIEGFEVLARRSAGNGELIAWIHDPRSNWVNDAKPEPLARWSNRKVTLPNDKSGTVEVWDTREGTVLKRMKCGPKASIDLPDFSRDIALRFRPG